MKLDGKVVCASMAICKYGREKKIVKDYKFYVKKKKEDKKRLSSIVMEKSQISMSLNHLITLIFVLKNRIHQYGSSLHVGGI